MVSSCDSSQLTIISVWAFKSFDRTVRHAEAVISSACHYGLLKAQLARLSYGWHVCRYCVVVIAGVTQLVYVPSLQTIQVIHPESTICPLLCALSSFSGSIGITPPKYVNKAELAAFSKRFLITHKKDLLNYTNK